jgi:hypothetical protein
MYRLKLSLTGARTIMSWSMQAGTDPTGFTALFCNIDIRDGKIWIQHDGTEEGIADGLVNSGIPKDRIVLAFKPPEIRPHTGFASA